VDAVVDKLLIGKKRNNGFGAGNRILGRIANGIILRFA
jgi:hypothetical protein